MSKSILVCVCVCASHSVNWLFDAHTHRHTPKKWAHVRSFVIQSQCNVAYLSHIVHKSRNLSVAHSVSQSHSHVLIRIDRNSRKLKNYTATIREVVETMKSSSSLSSSSYVTVMWSWYKKERVRTSQSSSYTHKVKCGDILLSQNECTHECKLARNFYPNPSRTCMHTSSFSTNSFFSRLSVCSRFSRKAYLIRSLAFVSLHHLPFWTFPSVGLCCISFGFIHIRIRNHTRYTSTCRAPHTHSVYAYSHFHFYFHFGGKFYSITAFSFPLNLILLTQWVWQTYHKCFDFQSIFAITLLLLIFSRKLSSDLFSFIYFVFILIHRLQSDFSSLNKLSHHLNFGFYYSNGVGTNVLRKNDEIEFLTILCAEWGSWILNFVKLVYLQCYSKSGSFRFRTTISVCTLTSKPPKWSCPDFNIFLTIRQEMNK